MTLDEVILDDYVLGRLSPEAMNDLSDKIANDEDLRLAADKHKEAVNLLEIYGMEAFRQMVVEVEESLDQKGFFSSPEERNIIEGIEWTGEKEFEKLIKEVETKTFADNIIHLKDQQEISNTGRIISLTRKYALGLAAALTLLVVAIIWVTTPQSWDGPGLYQEYFVLKDENLSEQVFLEMEEVGFSASDQEGLNQLLRALSSYNQQDFAGFIDVSAGLLQRQDLAHYKDNILLYRAISMMEMANYEVALEELQKIGMPTEHSIWYRALLLLKLDNIEEAQTLLKDEKIINSEYVDHARSIINKLQSS